jgi:hypothetical protein
VATWAPSEGCRLLAGHLLARSCCCSHKMKSALNPAAAPLQGSAGVGGLGMAIGYLAVSPTSTHALSSVQRASQNTSQMQSYTSGPAAGMTRRGMRSTRKASCQPYQAIGQAKEGYQNRNVHRLLAFSGERRLLPCLTWTM